MKKQSIIVFSLIAVALSFSTAAMALNLKQAKQQGLIGETTTGYVAVVSSNANAAKIVVDINAKRKLKYKEIAKRNGTNLQAVEKLAGQKSLKKTPKGQFINLGKGWKKK